MIEMSRVRHAAAACLLALAMAGCAPTEFGSERPSKADERLAAFEATGRIEKCLPIAQIERAEVLDGRTLLFEMRSGRYYVNRLPYGCPGLGVHDSFAYKTRATPQLCDTDSITVIETAGPGASCPLGEFEELTEKSG